MRKKNPAPDPFESTTQHRAEFLERTHTWTPDKSDIEVAVARPRYMSVDDYIDRYLIRMSETGRKPTSKQWLRWFIEDDAAYNERIAIEVAKARAGHPGYEDLYYQDGTPRSWPRGLGA